MFAKVLSACVQGIEGQIIEVEVDLSNGLPQVNLVGLPDTAVRESTERVRAAVKNCGFRFPMERVTINLAPADVRKEGSSFDLAIAVALLAASEQLELGDTAGMLIIGELSLDGALRPVPGVLSMVHHAVDKGIQTVILPAENAREAMLIEGIKVIAVSNLNEIRRMDEMKVNDMKYYPHLIVTDKEHHSSSSIPDYTDVFGQTYAKRALMISAAGLHNILLIGPPGTGKTMLIRRLPGILPEMADTESLEVTKIYSVAGKLQNRSHLIRNRPFRSPHHTISAGGLIGGGSIPRPGEVSLAHRGVLFLDEFPEFSRPVLEVLRQPLEDGHVTIGRARAVYTFPSAFILAASMNPCPCGYFGAETMTQTCGCSVLKINQYRAKISGPLLDRIDLHVEVPRIDYASLRTQEAQLSSAEMRKTVRKAHELQLKRYAGEGIRFNAELSGRLLRKYCRLEKDAEDLLITTFDRLSLSIRAHDRILKIARTIADLEQSAKLDVPHVAEAIQYRNLDRKM